MIKVKEQEDTLKESQIRFVDALRSGKYRYLCGAGTTGSGKTIGNIAYIHYLCQKVPNCRFAIFRKSEKNLKHTTIPSYKKVKQMTQTVGTSTLVDMSSRYTNGSEILFVWADVSKDRECDNVKGLELTGALFEEANQIDKRYYEICKTRIGRWNDNGVKPFIIINLNPSMGWVKDEFYDKWENQSLPDRHYFQEFDVLDAEDCSGSDYIIGLNDLAEEEYKRYVMNKWTYSDIPNQLIKYEWYKQCAVDGEPVINPLERGLLAIDPAWEGKDETGFGRMHGTHIGWFEIYTKQDPDDSGILGHARAQEFGIKDSDIIVDPIGVGAATVLKLRKGFKCYPKLFVGGADGIKDKSFLKMLNIRVEAHWLLREAMRLNEISITHSLAAQKQLLAVKYSVTDKVVTIQSKKDLMKETNISPTHLDLCAMLYHRRKTTSNELFQKLAEKQNKKKFTMNVSRAEKERSQIIKLGKMG